MAFIDESMRRRSGDAYVYALAAVLLEEHVCAELRERMLGLRVGRSQTIHWRDESPARHVLIAEAVARMPLRAMVVVDIYPENGKAERARRICLDRLLCELSQQKVETVCIETRDQWHDRRDRALVDALRGAGRVERGLRAQWRRSTDEPLLWLADVLVGSVVWWLGGEGESFDIIRQMIEFL
ncbi:DUF3800 domain-containing protein [Microbispora rosea]|uniref:DUF3800 domain-containing protein n=1 Tax=Microbispora rosea TaxID=58117 RepID=UPI00117EBF0E|nr:DUF3800 domain-containing protein [Microbispora rosea]